MGSSKAYAASVAAPLCFFLSLYLSKLFLADFIQLPEECYSSDDALRMLRQAGWRLNATGLFALCATYFLVWAFNDCCGLAKKAVHAHIIFFLAAVMVAMQNNFWAVHTDLYELPQQIGQLLLYAALSFYAFLAYRQFRSKKIAIGEKLWALLAGYQMFELCQVLYYKLFFDWPTEEQVMADVLNSAAQREQGDLAHYLPVIIFEIIFIVVMYSAPMKKVFRKNSKK